MASGTGDTERDIDLVLITGAGASTAFGVNGGRLPMMREWSDLLVHKLAVVGTVYRSEGHQDQSLLACGW